MGTRAMVCVQFNPNGVYELFYRHNDGNPDSLGFDLVSFLVKVAHEVAIGINKDTPEQFIKRMVEEVKLRTEIGTTLRPCTVEQPEDAFLKVQGDLEYIYAVSLGIPFSRTRFDLYKTSNPHTRKPFVFHVTGFYMMFAPQRIRDIAERMNQAEAVSSIALSAVAGYERAIEH